MERERGKKVQGYKGGNEGRVSSVQRRKAVLAPTSLSRTQAITALFGFGRHFITRSAEETPQYARVLDHIIGGIRVYV